MSSPARSVDLPKPPAAPPDPIAAVPPHQKYEGRIYTPLPRMWIGMVLAVLCLVCEFAGSEGLVVVVGWAGSGYWLFCVYRIHRILSEYTVKVYPISARKAVGFQIIPFFQWYWYLRWTKSLTRFIDERSGRKTEGSFCPGILLVISSVLGYYPPLKPLRLFFLLGVAFYLIRKLKKALPPCQPRRLKFKRAEQWHLAMSAGVGAICTFLLVEAILDLFDDGNPRQELATVLLVSLGMLLFLEPVFERLRGVFGIAEHSQTRARRPWLRLAAFAVLLFTNLFHGLLDTAINSAMTGDPRSVLDSLLRVMALLVVSGAITYSWIAAAHRFPSNAARSGLVVGLFATLALIVMTRPSVAIESKASAQPISQATLAQLGKGAQDVTNEVDSELQKLNTMLFAWPLFGIIGGLVIDRKWGKRRAQAVAMSILGTWLLYELLRLVSNWHDLHLSRDQGHEILCHFSAALGWSLALIVCSSPRILAPEGVPESEVRELRGKARGSRTSFRWLRAQPQEAPLSLKRQS